MDVLSDTMVVIISQYISALNQHVVDLKLTQCCKSIISQWSWKQNKQKPKYKHRNTVSFLCEKSQLSSPRWHMTATAWEVPQENDLAEPFLNFYLMEILWPNKVTCLNSKLHC